MTDVQPDTEEETPEPNLHLSIVDPDGEVVNVFDMVAGPGSAVAINGFHGSQVYELTPNDVNLQIKFVNITNFGAGTVPTEEEEPEPGMYTTNTEPAAEEAPADTLDLGA